MKNILDLCFCLIIVHHTVAKKESEDPSVKLLQQYIQINTTTGNDLTEATKFWERLAKEQEASFSIYELVKGYPIIVIEWKGTDTSLSSIILNSHVDVVPVSNEDKWGYPPFSGAITKDGYIVGRGSQDCKSVSIQHYQAMKRLKEQNIKLLRNVYLTILPDHETGSENGISRFLDTEEFKKMDIGGGIDEGIPYISDKIILFYQDKASLVLQVDCYGIETHGSFMADSDCTAIGKCAEVIESFQKYRESQVKYVKNQNINATSYFTSINLNKLQGGLFDNVLPGRVTLSYYINPPINTPVSEIIDELQERVNKIGGNITLKIDRFIEQSPGAITDDTNPYWTAISEGVKSQNLSFDPTITFDYTSAGIMRSAGIPVFGFSPLQKSEFLAHGPEEKINIQKFLNGISLFEKCIQNLANLSEKEVVKDTSKYLFNYDMHKKKKTKHDKKIRQKLSQFNVYLPKYILI